MAIIGVVRRLGMGKMDDYPLRLGLVLPQGTQSELGSADSASDWRQLKETALLAEGLGWDVLWTYDRTETLPRREPRHLFDGWTTIAALAEVTTRARLGLISPAAPFVNVAKLAKLAASVDVMSGGRLVLALEADGYLSEFHAHGLRACDAAARRRGLAETVSALRGLWSGKATSRSGEFVSIADAFCSPRPLQERVHILVQDAGPDEAALADSDGVMWRAGVGDVESRAGQLAQWCAGEGRDPASFGQTVLLDCRIFDSEYDRDRWLSDPNVIMFWSDHPDVYVGRNLIGTVDAVRHKLQRYLAGGVREVAIFFRDYPAMASMETFSREVVPEIRSAGSVLPAGTALPVR